MCAVVCLQTVWSGIEGWVCLINLGFGATQIELDGWLSSPQPQKSTSKGSQGLRDCEVEKGLNSWCRVCVGVLEVRLALV